MFFRRCRNIKSVVRRILTVANLLILSAFSVLYPLIEGLDQWDSPSPSSDSEIQIIALLTLVGMIFVLARLLVTLILSFREFVLLHLRRSPGNSVEFAVFQFVSLRNASPPLTLRI